MVRLSIASEFCEPHFLFHPRLPKFQPLSGWASGATKGLPVVSLRHPPPWEMQRASGISSPASTRTHVISHALTMLSASLRSWDEEQECPSVTRKARLAPALRLCLVCTGRPCLDAMP